MRKGTLVVHHAKAHTSAMAEAQSPGQHWQGREWVQADAVHPGLFELLGPSCP